MEDNAPTHDSDFTNFERMKEGIATSAKKVFAPDR